MNVAAFVTSQPPSPRDGFQLGIGAEIDINSTKAARTRADGVEGVDDV